MTGVTRDYSVEYRRYEEIPVPGMPLGRHVRIDSRSAFYPYRIAEPVPVVTKEWERHVPIFGQDVGSCTGEMEAGAVATDPLYAPLIAAGKRPPDQALAVALYSEATRLDGYPGSYPPDDTGSDGTAVSQAAKNEGLISGYLHAATLVDILQALMAGPVGLGSDWWSSMDTPDANGIVTIAPSAYVRGGHEYLARKVDPDRKLVGCDNSWTEKWGPIGGMFWLPYAVLEQLLAEGGDCVVPQPLGQVPPVPVPPVPPEPDPYLAAYLADETLGRWARRRPGTYAKRAYLQFREDENR